MHRIRIQSCGSFAQRSLASHRAAHIQGSISKGVFLLFPDRKVVFVSYQPFAGPLNLTMHMPEPVSLQVGDEALVSADEIYFPSANTVLDLRAANRWTAPAPPQLGHMHTGLEALARRVVAARAEDGWAVFLPHLLGWSPPPAIPPGLKTPANRPTAGLLVCSVK